MASTAPQGALEMSIAGETLRGTVGGTTLDCRVRLGVGLGGRLSPGVYEFSPPTEHPTMGTVASAALVSSGPSRGRGGGSSVKEVHSPALDWEAPPVMFNPERVEINKTIPWNSDSKDSPMEVGATALRWTGVGSPGTLVFAARAVGGWNDVIVLTSFEPLMRALTASGGCPLNVGS